jgi:hypothetical protein
MNTESLNIVNPSTMSCGHGHVSFHTPSTSSTEYNQKTEACKQAPVSFQQDNQEKLNKCKQIPPHPSYIAGFIDGDGCIFIRKITDGYQSGFTITQCRTNILQIIRYHFGGSITSSTNRNDKTINVMDDTNNYYHKHNVRNQYNLMIRSNEYKILLEYLQNSFVVKENQYQCLYEFNKLTNLPNKTDEKDKLHVLCSKYNEICKLNENNLSRLNVEYISGLFDAEGCAFIGNNNSIKITISQKNHPSLLYAIQKFLHYGKVDRNIEFIIYQKYECLNFIRLVKPFVIVKYNQIVAFETFLQTSDNKIKEQMYRICNKEKHKIENFIELNQNEEGKEGYLETIRLRELKQKVCNQIIVKEVYKQKSEDMMGEGNHNFGKTFSEEHKKKMSNSIRDAKNGVSDEIIIKTREMIQSGYKNVDIQCILGLPRHTLTRIKNGIIICRNEENKERKTLTQEESNISKRKIKTNEIIIVIEKYIEGIKPCIILDYLVEKRNKGQIPNELTIDIIKNIKRNLTDHKRLIYESEVSTEQYIYYNELLDKFTKQKCKTNLK